MDRRIDRDAALQRIYATVDSIPRGAVATYGQVALEAGLPRRARRVGRARAQLPAGSALPWHRVVNASGRASPRGEGKQARAAVARQLARLAREGVPAPGGRIDLARHRWRP
jgi:methylated-DNA-protein-cysteine methyltransferase-like protein